MMHGAAEVELHIAPLLLIAVVQQDNCHSVPRSRYAFKAGLCWACSGW